MSPHPKYTHEGTRVLQTLDGKKVSIPVQFPNEAAASDFAKAMTLGRRFSMAEDEMGEVVKRAEGKLRP